MARNPANTHAEHHARAPERLGIDESTGRRLHVCIINQYYEPDIAATAHLLHELAAELVKLGFDVRVLTSRPSYGPKETWVDCPMRETLDGVDVRRMWTTRFSKDTLAGRGINFVTYLGQLFLRLLVASRRDTVYLYTTSPPFLGMIAAAVSVFRKHHFVTLLYDSYPHVATWVGTFQRGGLIDKLWHRANRFYYNRCESAIVLCRRARELVHDDYRLDRRHIHVIPNWADGDVIRTMPKADSEFAAEEGVLETFNVMYSGNLGLYYDFETVLGAADRLRHEAFTLLLVGSGGKKERLRGEIAERNLNNTRLLNYRPIEKLADSLSAADASLVSIAGGIEGISFPSKLYSSLAVGRPILALSEKASELRELVERHRVGLWCKLGDAAHMEANIRWMMANPEGAKEMGRRARRLFERAFTKDIAAQRYARVLRAGSPLTRDTSEDLALDSISGEAEVEPEAAAV